MGVHRKIKAAAVRPVAFKVVQQLGFLVTGNGRRADQRPHETGQIAVALVWILGQRPEENLLQFWMQRGGHLGGFVNDPVKRRSHAHTLVRQCTREDFEGCHRKGIAVRGG